MEAARQTPPGARPSRNDAKRRLRPVRASHSGRLLDAPGNRRARGMAVTPAARRRPYRTRLIGRLICSTGARRENRRALTSFIHRGLSMDVFCWLGRPDGAQPAAARVSLLPRRSAAFIGTVTSRALGIRSLADSARLDQCLNCRRIADRNIESLTYLRPFDYVGISSNNRTALKRNAVLIGTLHGVVLSNFLISRGCRL